MIKEQTILNTIAECGIRVGNYDENCLALLQEAKKNWMQNDQKPLTPFVHTNVLLTNDPTHERVTAPLTIFFPFMFKIDRKDGKSATLLEVANANADTIENDIAEVESNLKGAFVSALKQGRSVFDFNFSSKYFGQADKAMLANFHIFAYVCDYTLVCLNL